MHSTVTLRFEVSTFRCWVETTVRKDGNQSHDATSKPSSANSLPQYVQIRAVWKIRPLSDVDCANRVCLEGITGRGQSIGLEHVRPFALDRVDVVAKRYRHCFALTNLAGGRRNTSTRS